MEEAQIDSLKKAMDQDDAWHDMTVSAHLDAREAYAHEITHRHGLVEAFSETRPFEDMYGLAASVNDARGYMHASWNRRRRVEAEVFALRPELGRRSSR